MNHTKTTKEREKKVRYEKKEKENDEKSFDPAGGCGGGPVSALMTATDTRHLLF